MGLSKGTVRELRLRKKAKDFKASIPTNMAVKLPDELLDDLKDSEIEYFYNLLSEIGLRRNGNYWERRPYGEIY